ncbi:MAG: hypothetical protein ACRDPS_04665 [Nocardioides sp.]|uniref:hypothetical protein n=1 Tax=Nocardioides sp. TaxID=35761 RepID=UPI003D6B5781
MSSQINVRPAELVTLADRCIDWAMDLTGAMADNAGALAVASGDAGNTQGGFDTMTAHGPLVEAGSSALESFAAVFEAGADALMLCAFDLSSTDEEVARAAESSTSLEPGPTPAPPEPSPGPTQPPEPSPLPSPSPGPSPTPPPS